SLLLSALGRLNPLTFFTNIRPAMLFAFSTSSSSATLPVTLNVAEHRLGIDNSVASFTLPLGATINMDGTAIMQGVATVFIAQAFNVDIGLSGYLMVIATATLASIGTAGVPGVGLITLAMVLQQVGLPVEGIAIIIGVDRLLDMMRTVVNISGDSMVSLVIANSEKMLNRDLFDDLSDLDEYREDEPA
ncbi:MAG: dicarboxylate/amino acid:cation symporter, partial [Pseudomonadales bacterium]|nr:dicarboxylate/amino acid:cation symporter [Pseudomonadales bacterium]